jgi:hypothetical protein
MNVALKICEGFFVGCMRQSTAERMILLTIGVRMGLKKNGIPTGLNSWRLGGTPDYVL